MWVLGFDWWVSEKQLRRVNGGGGEAVENTLRTEKRGFWTVKFLPQKWDPNVE
ncbi:hypothetical protein Csa_017213 [Cucumis sativus]|uniref:Uncharacterized protein n=1 Tax=Cucumis sativus TaxID=3659 RepID=A0A0A0K2G2_CUCSA|nr:hypothetical protein Csa_017213 [Cucumis sativus]